MRQLDEAILVIDVQNDFCPGGALAVGGGEQIITPINALVPEFAVRVFTQDWHPQHHQSFASQHPDAKPFTLTQMAYGPQMLWPDHCLIGSDGASFHRDLDTGPADLIVRKGFRCEIDSYSAFFENDHETPTGLDGYLRSRGVAAVTLVGLATDYCVNYSALDAAKLGFRVTVVQDLCRAIDMDGSLRGALSDMKDAGVTLI
jgi:nicotinamidase/pyrazinamidase